MKLARFAGVFLSSLALAAQFILPAAHEWQVARAEASHPYETWAPGESRLAGKGPRKHVHHDEDSCAVCPVLARLNGTWSPSLQAADHSVRLLGSATSYKFSELFEYSTREFPPRGPPQA